MYKVSLISTLVSFFNTLVSPKTINLRCLLGQSSDNYKTLCTFGVWQNNPAVKNVNVQLKTRAGQGV